MHSTAISEWTGRTDPTWKAGPPRAPSTPREAYLIQPVCNLSSSLWANGLSISDNRDEGLSQK